MNVKRTILMVIILLHYFVFTCFVLTVIGSFMVIKWFIATTLTALVVRVIFSSDECPLTTLENYYRSKSQLKKSRGFLKDYILNPVETFRYILKEIK